MVGNISPPGLIGVVTTVNGEKIPNPAAKFASVDAVDGSAT